MTDSLLLAPSTIKTQRLSVAPMMDWTTPAYRYFARLLHPHITLYTEMITTGALLHGHRDHYLAYHSCEHPVAIQLGGSNPAQLTECARFAEQAGYDEVNLNVGCPSDRVQNNKIGACLMAEPELVAECVHAMQQAVRIPVTVKHRIGIDTLDRYEDMLHFVTTVANAGCSHFIVHARIAILAGLSPKENREIPPLRYTDVYRLKQELPHLTIEINGGIASIDAVQQHLKHTDGVMIGRAAYQDPYLLSQLHSQFTQTPPINRFTVLEHYMPYIEQQFAQGLSMSLLSKHLLGLFQGLPGERTWRQDLSGNRMQSPDHLAFAIHRMHNRLAGANALL